MVDVLPPLDVDHAMEIAFTDSHINGKGIILYGHSCGLV